MAQTAWFGESLKSTQLAASDLSTKEFYAVTVGSSGVSLVSVQGQGGVKILTNKPLQGDPAQLWDEGETKVVAGAAVAVGQKLMTDTSGRLIPWVDSNGQVPVAEARSSASAAGDVFTAFMYGTTAARSTQTAADALVAAGTNRATALVLTAMVNTFGTVGSGTGAQLPAAKAGALAIVINNGANTLAIYGAGSDTIDGTAGSTGVTLTVAHHVAFFIGEADGKWVSTLGGAVAT